MDNHTGAIVIDSTKEKNDELKKKWKKINKFSNTLIKPSTTGFVVSLLSPFDFEGPVVEIITAAIAAVAFIMKKVSEHKLEQLENIKQEILDETDKETLLDISNKIGEIIKKR